MGLLKRTSYWKPSSWQPTSPKVLAENNIWYAATHGEDGGVEAALKHWINQVDEDDEASLVNIFRYVKEEDIQGLGAQIGDIIVGDGYSLLSIAIYRNLVSDVKYLVRQPSIALDEPSGSEGLAPLHIAVIKERFDIVKELLRNRSIAPLQLVNTRDLNGRTALHHAAVKCSRDEGEPTNPTGMSKKHETISLLLKYGANIDAQNRSFHTPLHLRILQSANGDILAFTKFLLLNGAEVNTKDEHGESPLHSACRYGHRELIQLLIDWGADMDCRNLDWKTPQDVFLSRDRVSENDRSFALDVFSGLKKPAMMRQRVGNLPHGPIEYHNEIRSICAEFPVYFRYQWPGLWPKPDGNASMSWIRSDMKVSHVLYPEPKEDVGMLEPVRGGKGFLIDCERKFKLKAWACWEEENGNNLDAGQKAIEDAGEADTTRGTRSENSNPTQKRRDIEDDVGRNAWRWINFPSNNMSWIKDFIIHNARYSEEQQLGERVWRFFEENIRIHETDSLYSRASQDRYKSEKTSQRKRETPKTKTEPSAAEQDVQSGGSNGTDANVSQLPSTGTPLINTADKGKDNKEVEPRINQSWKNTDSFIPGKMLSLVVPFLDIETEDQVQSGLEGLETQCQRVKKLNEAYSPFTGMHGVQHSQTLDQIYYNTESDEANLHTEKEQVIYRWSKKRNAEKKQFQERREHQQQQPQQLNQEPTKEQRGVTTPPGESNSSDKVDYLEKPLEVLYKVWQRLWDHLRRPPQQQQQQQQQLNPAVIIYPKQQDTDPIKLRRHGGRRATSAKATRIREDSSPKWLMCRQLWLWKLDDNTIITAIPSRANGMTADTLLETIRQGNLDILMTPNDLIKRILYETVTFLNEFKWAGLGNHILDIFEDEIATEASLPIWPLKRTNQEAGFFKDFSSGNWSPKSVNAFIQKAAHCTYRVRDIRDELRLLRQVFEMQAKVVRDFAAIFWPSDGAANQKQGNAASRDLRESFIRDCGLQSLIQRVRRMESDASTTLEGLSTIIQAMQAQASLKEAEQSRFLNLMILPFTIITVIFTPLSFLTSLFAVNTLGFPHNDEGEVRLPASWFSWRMVVGEVSSLLPLGLLVLMIYFWYGSESESISKQATRRRPRIRKVGNQEQRQRADV
ncbi:hypothetical protein F5Y11DRAFT_353549 [Daldinia sp. FL1419]|nr:hypothetical protein F5Y11DRAFT_353549 [Daldinia sp. FL1419]